jgi:hypothetical protein
MENLSLRLLKTRQQDTTIKPSFKKKTAKTVQKPSWHLLATCQLGNFATPPAGGPPPRGSWALLGHQGPGLVQGKMKDLGVQGAQLLAGNDGDIWGPPWGPYV